MPTCLPKNLIPGFEDTLRRATMSGMREATNVGRQERGEAKFSVESMLRFLDAAAVHTAARAKAEYLRPLWEERTPSLADLEEGDWGDDSTPTTRQPVLVDAVAAPSFPKGFDRSSLLRYRGTDQKLGGNLARRRTFGSNDDFKGRDAAPTDQQPRYIAEGGRLVIEGDDKNPSDATSSMVLAPKTEVKQESINLTSGSMDQYLNGKYDETTVYLIDGGNNRYEGIHKGGAEVDTAAPDGSYTLYYFDHACAQMPVRFESVLVELASSVAASGLPDGKRMEAGREGFQEEVQQYIAPAFDPRDLDR